MRRRAWLVYLPFALLGPCLPIAWPVPPVDFVLLLAAALEAELGPTLVAMVWVDVLLGQADCLSRWSGWLIWSALLLWQRERLQKLPMLAGATLLAGLLWYWDMGPALSWWSAGAVSLQGLGLLLWWRPVPRGEGSQGWGWRRP